MTSQISGIVHKPRIVSVADQVRDTVAVNGQPAVLLVPTDGGNMDIYYRGVGGAWWKAAYNEPGSTMLLERAEDIDGAVLVTLDTVQGLLSGELTING